MKRYKTNRGNLTALIRVGDRCERIKFIATSNGAGYFETTDAVLQKAIESDVHYGIKFTLDSTLQTNDLPKEKSPDATIVGDITTWQEARVYLSNAPFNIPVKELSSPSKIRAAATKLNLVFNNLKQ